MLVICISCFFLISPSRVLPFFSSSMNWLLVSLTLLPLFFSFLILFLLNVYFSSAYFEFNSHFFFQFIKIETEVLSLRRFFFLHRGMLYYIFPTKHCFSSTAQMVLSKVEGRLISVCIVWNGFKESCGLTLRQEINGAFQGEKYIVSGNRKVQSKLGLRESNWMRLQNKEK